MIRCLKVPMFIVVMSILITGLMIALTSLLGIAPWIMQMANVLWGIPLGYLAARLFPS